MAPWPSLCRAVPDDHLQILVRMLQFLLVRSLAFLLLPLLVSGPLSGHVGPTTTRDAKRGTVCNVLNYGGKASKTSDVGPAIQSAFAACKNGGTGTYSVVTLWHTSFVQV